MIRFKVSSCVKKPNEDGDVYNDDKKSGKFVDRQDETALKEGKCKWYIRYVNTTGK